MDVLDKAWKEYLEDQKSADRISNFGMAIVLVILALQAAVFGFAVWVAIHFAIKLW